MNARNGRRGRKNCVKKERKGTRRGERYKHVRRKESQVG